MKKSVRVMALILCLFVVMLAGCKGEVTPGPTPTPDERLTVSTPTPTPEETPLATTPSPMPDPTPTVDQNTPSPTPTADQNTPTPTPTLTVGQNTPTPTLKPTVSPAKPVIYLYPEKPTEVSVRLDFDGVLDFTYPRYEDGWEVLAYPDSRLVDQAGREYSYLFWEGTTTTQYDMSRGFVVKGRDTVAFLQEKLAYMGLTPREYNEFIVYWAPLMEGNAYNLIAFQGEVYDASARLTISPEPDSLLRVFMAYQPLDQAIEVPAQELPTFERTGFAVVEWGGAVMPR